MFFEVSYFGPHAEGIVAPDCVLMGVVICFLWISWPIIVVIIIPTIIPGTTRNNFGVFGENVAPYAIINASI